MSLALAVEGIGAEAAARVDGIGLPDATRPALYAVPDIGMSQEIVPLEETADLADVVVLDDHRPALYLVPNVVDAPDTVSLAPVEALPFDRPTATAHLGGLAVEHANIQPLGDLEGEQHTRWRYQAFVGNVATRQTVDTPEGGEMPIHRSSLDILQAAAEGDREAFNALLTDARTHVYEIYGGVGEGMTVSMDVNDEGEIVWAGQTTEDRQHHVLTSYPNQAPRIRESVHAEGLTGFRLEDRNRGGQLTGRRVFEFSAMSDATRKELSEWGYFLNSIACSIRTTDFGNKKCEVSTLFMAGVDQRQVKPKLEETAAEEAVRQERALEMRFDIRVLRKMYAALGTPNAEHMTPAELLGTPLVGPNTIDGLDMAMLYDHFASEEIEGDEQTFFGSVELWKKIGSPEVATREHYEQHMQEREQRHEEYESLCQDIVREQVARHESANTPREAVALKRRVVLDMTVDHAIDHPTIEADFGRVSNASIDRARWAYENGDTSGGDNLRQEAREKAKDGSCPPGEQEGLNTESVESNDSKREKDCNEVKDGDKVKCPYCKQEVVAKVPEPGGRIFCPRKACSSNKE